MSRLQQVKVNVSAADRARIVARAERRGMSMSGYLSNAALADIEKPGKDELLRDVCARNNAREAIAELAYEITKKVTDPLSVQQILLRLDRIEYELVLGLSDRSRTTK